MKVLFFLISLLMLAPQSQSSFCSFENSSQFGTIEKHLGYFLKQNKDAKPGPHTFIIETCPQGDSQRYGIYWIDGRSYFVIPWPPSNSHEFRSFSKTVPFIVNFNKHILKSLEAIPPKEAPLGQYQREDWVQSFLFSVAKEGIIVHVQK